MDIKPIHINGLVVGGYRSFAKYQEIEPFKKISIFIGKNNSGKTSLLKLIQLGISWMLAGYNPKIFLSDKSIFSSEKQVIWGFKPNYDAVPETVYSTRNSGYLIEALKNADSYLIFITDPHEEHDLSSPTHMCAILPSGLYRLTNTKLSLFCSIPTAEREITLIRESVNGEDTKEDSTVVDFPQIFYISSMRHIVKGDLSEFNLDGKGVTDVLAEWQENQQDNILRINSLLCKVTGERGIELRVEHEEEDKRIYVISQTNQASRALSHLGIGVQEAIMLSTYCLKYSSAIICIEEPELHMHPAMQRYFIDFLLETDNQYFITTHSAQIIDTALRDPEWSKHVAIFNLQQDNCGKTTVESIGENEKQELFFALSDLGYKASDLLQSNAILWVEGPSDKIYLNFWLKKWVEYHNQTHGEEEQLPCLEEGTHYSIVFYGGSSITHLLSDGGDKDENGDEFSALEKLLPINRNSFILADSDQTSDNWVLTEGKLKAKLDLATGSECQESRPGWFKFGWITDGREIENYIPYFQWEKLIKIALPRTKLELLHPMTKFSLNGPTTIDLKFTLDVPTLAEFFRFSDYFSVAYRSAFKQKPEDDIGFLDEKKTTLASTYASLFDYTEENGTISYHHLSSEKNNKAYDVDWHPEVRFSHLHLGKRVGELYCRICRASHIYSAVEICTRLRIGQ
jgi:hypothetical protein